jgi:hypothetical protein
MVEGEDPFSLVQNASTYFGADLTELRVLVAQGAKMWAKLKDGYPDAIAEQEMGCFLGGEYALTGHVDVISLNGDANILDWKTSRKDPSYKQQMLGYCWLALSNNSTVDRAVATIAWVRTGEVERYTMSRDQMVAWEQSIIQRVIDHDGSYHPGPQCEYCPRSHECPAANALARRDIAGIIGTTPDQAALDAMTPKQIVDLLEQARRVGRMAEAVQDAIKARVVARGAIQADDAKIVLESVERKQVLAMKALPVLEGFGFKYEALADVLSVSLTKAKCHVADSAPRGAKASQAKAFVEALEAAGAIETTISHKLQVKRSV